jgi:AcrR family transcriptional regulator
MQKQRLTTPAQQEDSCEKLLRAAKKVFAKKGYDGATVKELADTAHVNVSLVSYHFGGKEGLYRTCLEQFGRSRLATAQRLLTKPESSEEFKLRLKLFVEEVVRCHFEELEVTQIITRECDQPRAITQDIFKSTFLKAFETLQEFFESARGRGFLRIDMDTYLVAEIFFGAILWSLRMSQVSASLHGFSIRESVHREKFVQHVVDLVISGCGGVSPGEAYL